MNGDIQGCDSSPEEQSSDTFELSAVPPLEEGGEGVKEEGRGEGGKGDGGEGAEEDVVMFSLSLSLPGVSKHISVVVSGVTEWLS